MHIGLASFIAGPAVLFFLLVAQYITSIPQPIVIPWRGIPAMLVLVPLSAAVGLIPALLCNAIGSVVMVKLGELFPLLRFPFLWPIVGGVAAGMAADAADFSWRWTFAYSGAGALSAMICRMRLA